MICPKCEDDYGDEGHTQCIDCRVLLVRELPPKPEPIKFQHLLSSYNIGDVALIKSILDAEQIIYYFHGEYYSRMDPLIQPARLMVDEAQVEEAKELLKDLNISFLGLNLSQSDEGSEEE